MARFIVDWAWGQEGDFKGLRDGCQSETKRTILFKIGRTPMTVTKLADDLDLSRTAIYDYVKDMERRGLIKGVEPPKKEYRIEKYYGLNVPFCTWEDLQTIDKALGGFKEGLAQLAPQISMIFERNKRELLAAFDRTSMKARGYTADDVAVVLQRELQDVVQKLFSGLIKLPKRPWGFVLVEMDDSLLGS